MGLKTTIVTIFLLGISSTTSLDNTEFLSGFQTFNQNLFQQIVKSNGNENLIFSPFSIQTCLAMTRMGAVSQTADEMDQGMGFTGQNPESVAYNFYSLLAKYEKSDILTIANKVYVMKDLELKENYNELLAKKFFSSAENIDFGDSVKAAEVINTWVESKTNDKIQNLISPDTLDSNTKMVLLNAVYFNGKWENAFDKKYTKESTFYLSESESEQVPMMYKEGKCDFHTVDELRARVLRLPYKDSDLTMLVILPLNYMGLSDLETRLGNFSFKSLGPIITKPKCAVLLPKFKTEFKIDLKSSLLKMGMKHMFTDAANFSKMLKSNGSLNIDSVIHKAVIDVSEEGTVAAAVTATSHRRKSPYPFEVNHAFAYAIVNEDYVPLFQGVVVKP